VAYIIDQATYNKQVTSNPGLLTGWKGALTGGATIVRSTQESTKPECGRCAHTGDSDSSVFAGAGAELPSSAGDLRKVDGAHDSADDSTTPDGSGEDQISFIQKPNTIDTSPPVCTAVGGRRSITNFSQGLNLQQIYGVGAGFTAIKNPKQELDVKADVHYERQNFEPPTVSDILIGSTLPSFITVICRQRSSSRSPEVTSQRGITSATISAIAAAGLQLPVYKRFGMNVNVLDNYLNNPAVGYNKKNSFQFVTSITYSLP